jgi:ubiquinol-cytochrome c reductase core subunit 2
MLARSARTSAVKAAARTIRSQQQRGLAAPASGSFVYETAEAAGVKIASRDIPGPVSSIALVSQAGTRFEKCPGLAEGLKWSAFKVRLEEAMQQHWTLD